MESKRDPGSKEHFEIPAQAAMAHQKPWQRLQTSMAPKPSITSPTDQNMPMHRATIQPSSKNGKAKTVENSLPPWQKADPSLQELLEALNQNTRIRERLVEKRNREWFEAKAALDEQVAEMGKRAICTCHSFGICEVCVPSHVTRSKGRNEGTKDCVATSVASIGGR